MSRQDIRSYGSRHEESHWFREESREFRLSIELFLSQCFLSSNICWVHSVPSFHKFIELCNIFFFAFDFLCFCYWLSDVLAAIFCIDVFVWIFYRFITLFHLFGCIARDWKRETMERQTFSLLPLVQMVFKGREPPHLHCKLLTGSSANAPEWPVSPYTEVQPIVVCGSRPCLMYVANASYNVNVRQQLQLFVKKQRSSLTDDQPSTPALRKIASKVRIADYLVPFHVSLSRTDSIPVEIRREILEVELYLWGFDLKYQNSYNCGYGEVLLENLMIVICRSQFVSTRWRFVQTLSTKYPHSYIKKWNSFGCTAVIKLNSLVCRHVFLKI